MSDLELYAQYAGASYCNDDAAVGAAIVCSDDVCPDVTAANATVLATMR